MSGWRGAIPPADEAGSIGAGTASIGVGATADESICRSRARDPPPTRPIYGIPSFGVIGPPESTTLPADPDQRRGSAMGPLDRIARAENLDAQWSATSAGSQLAHRAGHIGVAVARPQAGGHALLGQFGNRRHARRVAELYPDDAAGVEVLEIGGRAADPEVMPGVEDQPAVRRARFGDDAPRVAQRAQRRPRKELERTAVAIGCRLRAQLGERLDRFVDRSGIARVEEHAEAVGLECFGDAEDLVDRMTVAWIG